MAKINDNQGQSRNYSLLFRVTIFSGIVVIVLGAAALLLKSELWPTRPVADESAVNLIDIEADMAGFSQDVIKAKVGEPITVRLTSLDNSYHMDGGGKHQFAIDELGVNIIAPPEGSNSATFTPNKAGTFVFYCDICCGGRANPSMRGELIVES